MKLIQGLLIGAGCMYFLDPDRGKRRRALVRDQATHQMKLKREDLKVMRRDFANRSRGLVHTVQNRLQGDHPDDIVLVERVRSAIGRCCTQTHGIEVFCNDGVVTLTGPALATEVMDLVGTVKNVRGVTRVINNLEIHDATDGISTSGSSGTSRLTPAECLVAVCAGTALCLVGVGRRGIIGWILGGAGVSLLAKGFSDTEHRFDQRSDPSRHSAGMGIERAHVADI